MKLGQLHLFENPAGRSQNEIVDGQSAYPPAH